MLRAPLTFKVFFRWHNLLVWIWFMMLSCYVVMFIALGYQMCMRSSVLPLFVRWDAIITAMVIISGLVWLVGVFQCKLMRILIYWGFHTNSSGCCWKNLVSVAHGEKVSRQACLFVGCYERTVLHTACTTKFSNGFCMSAKLYSVLNTTQYNRHTYLAFGCNAMKSIAEFKSAHIIINLSTD